MNLNSHRANRTELSLLQITSFIERHDNLFNGQLLNHLNYSRVVSLAHFENIVSRLDIQKQDHVGVVSGSINDPELKLLSTKLSTILSFEQEPIYDLDQSWLSQHPMNFSFTLCNQTLEHVFNPHVAIKNLVHHTRKNGYLYLSVPTINCIHGEPFFYSSGFHPRFLSRLGQENNLAIIDIGWWGSYKYMINAVSGQWLPDLLLRAESKPLFRHKFKNTKPSPVKIPYEDGRINQNEHITDCWVLFQKR
jgi:hypothetical protein